MALISFGANAQMIQMYTPVLGGSQVFFKTHWVQVLEEFTRPVLVFWFFYFLFLKDSSKFQKFGENIFT
jgi:hypothetical protein